ncbi:MAG: universal stress protein [Actinomycetota bacterium]|nr:universal stress protein [Actinomycetota bacterium]
MIYVVVAVVWVAIGVATGLVEARRGHWAKTWVLGAILGPFAVPLAISARGREDLVPPLVLSESELGVGRTDVLVGIDGSPASAGAARAAARLFGSGAIGRMALASVLDYDAAAPHADSVLYPEPWDEERASRERLSSLATEVAAEVGVAPATVLLAGRPADKLEAYALDEGFDVLVTGCRGRGLSKALLGSCASSLASGCRVPVLLVPDGGPVGQGRRGRVAVGEPT